MLLVMDKKAFPGVKVTGLLTSVHKLPNETDLGLRILAQATQVHGAIMFGFNNTCQYILAITLLEP